MEAAADHSPNHEQLSLWGLEERKFDRLQRFTNLIELELGNTISIRNLSNAFGYRHGLNKLKKLRVRCHGNGFYDDYFYDEDYCETMKRKNQQAVVSLAKMHRNIEQYHLYGVDLNEATVVDFVRFASKLKSLHLHRCDIFATSSLINKLVNVRKCNEENSHKLKLFLSENDKNDLDAIDEIEAKKYLNVKIELF